MLFLNRELLKTAGHEWTDESIRARTAELADAIIAIWPVPAGHRSGFHPDKPGARKKVRLSDLINAGTLTPGMPLFPRRKKLTQVATLLADGQIEVEGVAYAGPTEAATAMAGKQTSGWWFFLTDQASRRSLRKVRSEYAEAMAVDTEDDASDDNGDDGDDG